MGGLISRNWVWSSNDGEKFVFQLHHHTITGYRCVMVNGQQVYTNIKVFDDGDVINIDIGCDVIAKMIISISQLDFVYTMLINGKELKEMVSESKEGDVSKISVIAPSYEVKKSQEDEDVVFYNIHTTIDGKLFMVSKRFSEITELHTMVYGAFSENHLQDNLPECPPKHLKFWTDHLATEFLEDRRLKIEVYFKKLIAVPKVQSLPDIRRFLAPTNVSSSSTINTTTATTVATTTTTTDTCRYTATIERRNSVTQLSKFAQSTSNLFADSRKSVFDRGNTSNTSTTTAATTTTTTTKESATDRNSVLDKEDAEEDLFAPVEIQT